jgi:general secretion pathway protein I
VSAPRAARGFTLLEVLVALAIVVLGMSALMTTITSSADSTSRLREKSFAEWVGFNQLSLTRLTLTAPTTGTMEGDVDFANGNWHWLQTIDQIELPGVLRITVQVRRNVAGAAAVSISKNGWLATVVGFYGTSQGAANGTVPTWNAATFGGSSGQRPAGSGTAVIGGGLGGFTTGNGSSGNGITTAPTNTGGTP